MPLTVPPTVSTFNGLLNWYLFFGIGASVIVIGLLAYFMAKYRYRGEQGPPPPHKTEGWKIVLVTALISLTILTAAEYQTFASFSNVEIPQQCYQKPDPCVTIHVLAFQWGWNFTYPNGKFTVSTANQPLALPVDTVAIMNVTSKDVFHSFGISQFAIKEDAIPGRSTQLWVEATQTGFYPLAIRCFELCGVGHAFMDANLTVIDAATWKATYGVNSTG